MRGLGKGPGEDKDTHSISEKNVHDVRTRRGHI